MNDDLTRKTLRHLLLRRRNERIVSSRDESWPVLLRMHHVTLSELLMDSDPAEQHTVDFEGTAFMGIPILTDDVSEVGAIHVDWPPTPQEAPRA